MTIPKLKSYKTRRRAGGVAAVEFALLALAFFTFVFGIMEVARLIYVYNTLQEVTRRAAASAVTIFPRDTTRLDAARYDAVFRSSPGGLVLAPPVTSDYVRIDYMALTRDSTGAMSLSEIPAGSLPTCPGQNRQICTGNPNAPNCVRFVRARICDPSVTGDCVRATSNPLFPIPLLNPVPGLTVRLHMATTIANAEMLGYVPGTAPCAAPAATP
nr:TadE/TadG family type IV pilus assembly protein [uncultured Massilia sp.]